MQDMPEPKLIDPIKVASVAQELVKLLLEQDSEIRQRAVYAAMTILGESSGSLREGGSSALGDAATHAADDLGNFFQRDEELKPSDTAFLCAAYHFSQFGMVTFSVKEIRDIAAEAGEVIPNRVDNTFREAAKNGKRLFQAVGNGSFKPTASGALYFRERWNVKPGRNPKQTTEDA